MKKLIVLAAVLLVTACGPRGRVGSQGPRGDSGLPGSDGFTTLFQVVEGDGEVTFLAGLDLDRSGTLEANEVTASATVKDGERGADGTDGADAAPTQFTPVAIIDPCGKQSNYDEVLVRLANGQILASFSENSNGKNTRFVLLGAGNYATTDGTNCTFSVDASGNVTF